MASFRVLGQFVQYFLNDGTVNDGGSITFYETDLTTLKNTYSDINLTVLNPNPVPLDADGRLANDVWGSGVYGAVLADPQSVTIQTLNNIQSGADPGFSIPALVTGEFLSNDGSNLLWQPIQQVPDPTGEAGNFLGTDGTLLLWQPVPTPAGAGITVATNGVGGVTATATAGTSGAAKLMIQTGTGSIPASGINQANGTITFATAFSAPPVVNVTLTTGSACASGFPVGNVTSVGTTGCGVSFNNSRDASSGGAITGTVTYAWVAIGLSP